MLRRRLMGKRDLMPGAVSSSNAQALDVVFSKNDGSELIIISGQENWPDSGYIPVGIVVVPGTHNRYGDGTCGVMSLVQMDYSNPETGYPVTSATQTDSCTMYPGCYGYSIGNYIFSGRPYNNENYIPYQTSSGSAATSIGGNSTIVWPYNGTTTNPGSGPSTAYSNNGDYVTETTGYAMCDFNGIRNTMAIYCYTRSNNNWKNSKVTNSTAQYISPATMCAGRFKTIGTESFYNVYKNYTSNSLSYGTNASNIRNTGYWYFPAMGEMCYIHTKRYSINETLVALNGKYGNVASKIMLGMYVVSGERSNSTEHMLGLNFYNGSLTNANKNTQYRVRAFMRL